MGTFSTNQATQIPAEIQKDIDNALEAFKEYGFNRIDIISKRESLHTNYIEFLFSLKNEKYPNITCHLSFNNVFFYFSMIDEKTNTLLFSKNSEIEDIKYLSFLAYLHITSYNTPNKNLVEKKNYKMEYLESWGKYTQSLSSTNLHFISNEEEKRLLENLTNQKNSDQIINIISSFFQKESFRDFITEYFSNEDIGDNIVYLMLQEINDKIIEYLVEEFPWVSAEHLKQNLFLETSLNFDKFRLSYKKNGLAIFYVDFCFKNGFGANAYSFLSFMREIKRLLSNKKDEVLLSLHVYRNSEEDQWSFQRNIISTLESLFLDRYDSYQVHDNTLYLMLSQNNYRALSELLSEVFDHYLKSYKITFALFPEFTELLSLKLSRSSNSIALTLPFEQYNSRKYEKQKELFRKNFFGTSLVTANLICTSL